MHRTPAIVCKEKLAVRRKDNKESYKEKSGNQDANPTSYLNMTELFKKPRINKGNFLFLLLSLRCRLLSSFFLLVSSLSWQSFATFITTS